MLQSMSQAATLAPPPTAASFATLLAALAAPAPKPDAGWNDDDLAEDVATLSYERALRSHGRYRSSSSDAAAIAQEDKGTPFSYDDELDESARQPEAAPNAANPVATARVGSSQAFANAHAMAQAEMDRRAAAAPPSAFERNLKSASITIRVSKAECVQLHQRAAEAGLTVSAYLRSCTFEAEALRAQVKETLAELRSASSLSKSPSPAVATNRAKAQARHGWLGFTWVTRLLPHWHPSQRVARA